MSSKVTFSERKTLHSKIKVVYKLCLFINEFDPGLMWSGVQEGRLLDSPFQAAEPKAFTRTTEFQFPPTASGMGGQAGRLF